MSEANEFEIWETIKSFYKEKFGIAPELVDIAPVFDLLKLCASGASNNSIAKFFNESEWDLITLFDAHFGFNGWTDDLSFSPLKVYKENDFPDFSTFKDIIITRFGTVDKIDKMYESARLIERLERLFNEKWI